MSRKKQSPAPGVTVLKDGRFKVLATCRTPQGRKYAEETLPLGSSLGQAIDRRAQLALELRARSKQIQGQPGAKPEAITFEAFAKVWISRQARDGYAPRTIEHNAYKISWALPVLGPLEISAVNLAVLEDVRDEIEVSPKLSRRSGTEIWSAVRQLVRRAWVEHGVALTIDPFTVIRPPRCKGGRTTDKRALRVEEVRLVLDRLEANVNRGNPGHGRQRRLEAELMLAGGLRVGEVFAMRWEDFDPERQTVTVQKTVEKTRRGREVALPETIVHSLISWRQEMIRVQHKGLATGLVFPSPMSGKQRHYSGMSSSLKIAARGVGVEVDVHSHTFRRTANRLAVEAGVQGADLRAQLGHIGPGMTELYMGPRLADKVAVADAVAVGWLDPVVGPEEGEGAGSP